MVGGLRGNPLGDKRSEYVVWMQRVKLGAIPQTDECFRSIDQVDIAVLEVLEKPLSDPA